MSAVQWCFPKWSKWVLSAWSYLEHIQAAMEHFSRKRWTVWPDKNRQISIEVAQIWFHYKNEWFWHLYENAGDLGKIIVATCFEWLPKVQKNRPIWSYWRWTGPVVNQLKKWSIQSWNRKPLTFTDWIAYWEGRAGTLSPSTKVFHMQVEF